MWPTGRKRRSSGELRTRSGCWVCRERRVKCSEERPVCYHCRRLGLKCHYSIRLSWQTSCKFGAEKRSSSSLTWKHARHQVYSVPIEGWMFLNTVFDDFEPAAAATAVVDRPSSPPSRSDLQTVCSALVPTTPDLSPSDAVSDDLQHLLSDPYPLLSLDFLPLYHFTEREAQLWSYFDEFIIPKCSQESFTSPYRKVIMRLAASSLDGPLFQCIMAVSARQRQILGHGQADASCWLHRKKALSLLRGQISQLEVRQQQGHHVVDGTPEQIIASTVMLCFFEILSDCSNSWEVHTGFCQTFLLWEAAQSLASSSPETSDLFEFAAIWITSHNALASTAGLSRNTRLSDSLLTRFIKDDEEIFQSLTGCPRRLIEIMSEISSLHSEALAAASSSSTSPPATTPTGQGQSAQKSSLPPDIQHRRDEIERELHNLPRPLVQDNSAAVIAETRRLATLLYLYARVDSCGPSHPQMSRLTAQLLALLPQVSLRTNAGLWPIFMVATLGLRPESDGDRRLVLATLDRLQQTRQLGNVRKARLVIEQVWKARDLKRGEAYRGWEILRGRCDSISLA